MNIIIHIITTINMKPVDLEPRISIDFNVEKNDNPKFEVGDHVKISKYKNIFPKVTLLIGLKKF